MDEEKIIRDEARYFSNVNLIFKTHIRAIEQFKLLKGRLVDFYSAEYKAIFLDEIERQLTDKFLEHVQESEENNTSIGQAYQNYVERLLFYIKQELNTLPLVARQKHLTNPDQLRDQVFVSFSPADKEYLEEIKKHFKPFEDQINFWDNSEILPGENWKEAIQAAIDKTKVIILLVTADFLASDFIISNELPPLLQAAENNGAVVLIVLLKPCLFEVIDELKQYQTMNPINRPVIKMDLIEREELYVNLVRQTKRILSEK